MPSQVVLYYVKLTKLNISPPEDAVVCQLHHPSSLSASLAFLCFSAVCFPLPFSIYLSLKHLSFDITIYRFPPPFLLLPLNLIFTFIFIQILRTWAAWNQIPDQNITQITPCVILDTVHTPYWNLISQFLTVHAYLNVLLLQALTRAAI